MLWSDTSLVQCKFPVQLAKVLNFEISGLAHSFLIKIEENVNPGTEKRQFSKIPFENRQNMQSQIVVCQQEAAL